MQIRKFQNSDINKIVDLLNLIRERDELGDAMALEESLQLFSAPHFAAEENFFVLYDGIELLGIALQLLRPNSGLVIVDISIHPDYRETEAAQMLLAQTEKRALERLPHESHVSLIMTAPDKKAYLRPFLHLAEYEEIRRTYVMRIDLDSPISAANFPDGFALRPFKLEDGQAVFAVFLECFAEHFGEISKIPYEQWAYPFSTADFDPSIFYILYHEEDIAGICLCELSDKDARLALVETLGVRPKFRGRGLGAALLSHAFAQFQERGFAAVALDVDAENTTNAVALYQNVGMRIESITPAYHKALR